MKHTLHRAGSWADWSRPALHQEPGKFSEEVTLGLNLEGWGGISPVQEAQQVQRLGGEKEPECRDSHELEESRGLCQRKTLGFVLGVCVFSYLRWGVLDGLKQKRDMT